MTDLRKAAEMALESLEDLDGLDTETECVTIYVTDEIEALRTALAQPEHNHLSDAMRLYQAVDRLATQAGEDAGETIDWLCGEHGGMSKLFEAYFSPKPIANPVENLEPVPVWLENDLAFKEIMKWADIYAAQTGEIYAQAALDSSKTATMARERKTLTFVVASYTSPISEPVKERISEPVENLEPVAWVERDGELIWHDINAAIGRNLYTAPPKREWQELTDEDWHNLPTSNKQGCERDAEIFDWIEDKLKEKNT